MAAGQWSFVVEKGSGFSKTITWYVGTDENGDPIPQDVTDYDGLLQVRKSPTALEVLWELSVGAGTIDFGEEDGTIVLEDTAAHTAALNWKGRAFFDLVVVPPGGDPIRLLEGRVTLSPAISQP